MTPLTNCDVSDKSKSSWSNGKMVNPLGRILGYSMVTCTKSPLRHAPAKTNSYLCWRTCATHDRRTVFSDERNAKHSTFLNRVTRDERRVASLRHKYVGSQLVETLNKFLSSPDSPAKTSAPAKKLTFCKKSTPASKVKSTPKKTPMNFVNIAEQGGDSRSYYPLLRQPIGY